ncbi:helix-turn-helix transcriptional regulator [Streptomyces sp. NA04227]|uniref:helix-turn-helix transcriptional regulator n=1 Tax=Streptomyces sp. NA04227 TaxID=2742136 RepID=UPI0015924A76|nr:helix-turn-helix transcriptional regulator [Streptomyces sp. NA04227]QKW08126.1 helix-turn-helix transcriptional regulator [Streptomyces sp. NA04227]
MLEALGIGEDEELLYRRLLSRPARTLAELSDELGAPRAVLRRRLRVLQDAGLVTKTPTRPLRYLPAPPGPAVEVLVARRQEQLERARTDARELTLLWEASAEPSVEVVQGAEANIRRFLQTQHTARQEILTLDKPPYVTEGVRRQADVQKERMAQGVCYRTLYDRQSLLEPEQQHLARELAAHGEVARVLDGVPLKALIADGAVALVPVVLHEDRHTVVLHSSPLLDGMKTLFELLWQRATPLWPTGGARDGHGDLSDFDRLLLGYAAIGCTDQATARKTGLNQRTIERHMRRIMDTLGARTRFQAGLQAGLQGYLGDGRPVE